VTAYCNRGSLLVDLGQYEAAVHSCDLAIAIDRKCALAYANRAAAHYLSGRLDLALGDLECIFRPMVNAVSSAS
jgi:lipoprotein NlpI